MQTFAHWMTPQHHHTSRVGVAQCAQELAQRAMPPAILHMLLPLECPMQHKIGTAAKTYHRMRCHKVQCSVRRDNISVQRWMVPATRGHKSAVCASTALKSTRARRPQQPTLALASLKMRPNSCITHMPRDAATASIARRGTISTQQRIIRAAHLRAQRRGTLQTC